MSAVSPQFCKQVVWGNWGSHQCSRKPWKDGYCKQHHPDTVKSREAKRTAKWDAESKRQRLEEARSAVADAAMEWYRAFRDNLADRADQKKADLYRLCRELAKLE